MRHPIALATMLDSGRSVAIDENLTAIGAQEAHFSPTAFSWARLVLGSGASPGIFRCDEGTDAFVERIMPPQSLVIFGAGRDVIPVVTFGRGLGWHVTVVGAGRVAGISQRFCNASVVHVTSADDPLEGIDLRRDSAVVLMTHNLARDRQILARLPSDLPYLGILGPLKRTRRLLAESPAGRAPANVFAPVGMDVGAETPEEIALAIVAEIQAALRRTAGGSLRDRPGPIHPLASEPSHPNSERPNRSAECQSSAR
jgi:xanthine/CO dehydrogenase XdhC/CoxF family maturation factor